MSEPQAEYDTDDPQPTPRFSSTPWYASRIGPDDVHIDEVFEAVVWDSIGDHVASVTTQLTGNGDVESAIDRARLIAAAGTATSELPDEYDAVAAVEALLAFIQKTESVTEHLSAVVEELLAVAQEEDAVDDAYAASKAADIIGEIESEVRKRLIPVLKSARGDTDE